MRFLERKPRRDDVPSMAANPDEYARLYRDRMRTVFELMRPSFRPAEMDPASSPAPESSRASEYSRLTTASVLYVRAMVAPARRLFAWGVPTAEAIEVIRQVAGVSGVVEIGAGTGYWTHILRLHGVPVTAYDLHPCDGADTNGHHASSAEGVNPPPFASVRTGGADAAAAHPSASLLLCWPPREDAPGEVREDVSTMAVEALRAYRGDVVLYVGESPATTAGQRLSRERAGATAGPAFHRALLADWIPHREVILPRWPGASDSLTIWRRKERSERAGAGASASASATPAADARAFPDDGATTRAALARAMREGWEEASVAHVVERARRGGHGAGRGAERRALDAVRRRSGWMRRALLAFL